MDPVALAKFTGLVWPTLYAGITAQCYTISDSLTFVEPIIQHAPNQKVMAKQWLLGYQYGPLWVPPLVAPATIANLYLAYLCPGWTGQRAWYLAAAAGIWSIFPITFFYMEPGINGAAKWKVQCLGEAKMEDTRWYYPSAHRHGGTMASRRWAEGTGMRELVLYWRWVNNWRAVVAFLAAVGSGYASWGFEGERV